jgi:hypothetical protein
MECPNFNLKGLLTWLVAFKQNVGLNFYKGVLIEDIPYLFMEDQADEKGNRIIKFKSHEEIDAEKLKGYISQAVLLNEKGIQITKKAIIIDNTGRFSRSTISKSIGKECF